MSAGNDDSPYYEFYTDFEGTLPLILTNTLYLDKTYVFSRVNAANSHPFYISNTVLAEPDPNKITVTASNNKTYNDGIRQTEVLNLEFTGLTTSDTLYDYGTNYGIKRNM